LFSPGEKINYENMIEKIQYAMDAKYRRMRTQKNELEAYIECVMKTFPETPEMPKNTTIDDDIKEQRQDVGFDDIRLDMRSIEGIYEEFCAWLSPYRRGKNKKNTPYVFLQAREKYQSIERIFDEIIELNDCL
jgi:hypothetical protein